MARKKQDNSKVDCLLLSLALIHFQNFFLLDSADSRAG